MVYGYYITKDLVGGGCLHYLSDFRIDIGDDLTFIDCVVSHKKNDSVIYHSFKAAQSIVFILNHSKFADVQYTNCHLQFEFKVHKAVSKFGHYNYICSTQIEEYADLLKQTY